MQISESLFYFNFETENPKKWPGTKKIITLWYGLRKKWEFPRFLTFRLGQHKQNQKLDNIGKFSFALNFDCFSCIKCRKVESFYWILKE